VKRLRKILFPFSILYGEIVEIRNKAFEKGMLSSNSFLTPTIVVGNLNVGGTGKSPQIEYLIRLLKGYSLAVLSRGYKRKSKGFQLADKSSTVSQIGDEPLQFYRKFENIIVAVDTDRSNGIRQLEKLKKPLDIILLDDAFQHRKVKGGLNILLTSFGDLYADDFVLPTGNLREKRKGAERANIIIVTKCPDDLTKKRQSEIILKLNIEPRQSVYFSTIEYHHSVISSKNKISISELSAYKVLLVTGIANGDPLVNFLKEKNIDCKHLKFPDHHDFTELDKEKIMDTFDHIDSVKKILLTTEKDYVRSFSNHNKEFYYVPIQTKILEKEEEFNKQVLNYVRLNTVNRCVIKK